MINIKNKSSRRPLLILLTLFVLALMYFAGSFIWQTLAATGLTQNAELNVSRPEVSSNWHQGSKIVNLDDYIAANQVSQNIIDKKQRVMLEPELIHFDAVLQTQVTPSKAELVTDALAVWGVTPLPEVGFSSYIRSPQGQVIGVYVENAVAEHIRTFYTPEAPLEFQAYRLYNYAKGPRLLLVGVKRMQPVDIEQISKS